MQKSILEAYKPLQRQIETEQPQKYNRQKSDKPEQQKPRANKKQNKRNKQKKQKKQNKVKKFRKEKWKYKKRAGSYCSFTRWVIHFILSFFSHEVTNRSEDSSGKHRLKTRYSTATRWSFALIFNWSFGFVS